MANKKIGRKEIIKNVAKRSEITSGLCEKVVTEFFEEIQRNLLSDDRIIFQKIFSLWLTERAPRISRNPKDGTQLLIPATKVVSLRISKELKSKLSSKSK